ncbi:sirohydrochlorin chelatase [Pseudotabrizicola sp. L79]|uniref:sirohydrochlorin chelatase n=1 Tax=Pseudotabrizicola sp. L79 TaxID=3118402 RepID=UPI002F9399A7
MTDFMPAPPPVLIVSHGQPSDPAPAAAEMAAFAAQVAQHVPGCQVGSVTLAEDGALAAAVARLGPGGLVFPMFMAGGWFTSVNLPKRLAEAGGTDWQVLEPFGTVPEVQALAVDLVREAGLGAGGNLLLAAHGSFRSAAPSDVANAVALMIKDALGLARSEAAFIDQSPRLAEVRGFGDDAVCLPFFAAKGGHVIDDIPQALAEAGFTGRVLEPLGLDPRVPGLVAARLRAVVAGLQAA